MTSIVFKMNTLKKLSLFIIFLVLVLCRYSTEAFEKNSAYLIKKEIKEKSIVFCCCCDLLLASDFP